MKTAIHPTLLLLSAAAVAVACAADAQRASDFAAARTAAGGVLASLAAVEATWRGAELGQQPRIYEGPRPGTDAICFSIMRGESVVGLCVVRKTDGRYVVQEVSHDPPVHVMPMESLAAAARNCAGGGRRLGKPSFLHFGPLQRFVRFPVLLDGRVVSQITLDPVSQKIVDGSVSPYDPDGLSPGLKSSISGSRILAARVTGIGRFRHRHSEEATCLAMIFAYWAERGFPALRRESPSKPGHLETPAELTAAVADMCGKCGNATGMQLFGSSRGYRIHVQRCRKFPRAGEAAADLHVVQSEMLAKRPMLLVIGTPGISRCAVVVGLRPIGETRFLLCIPPGVSADEDSAHTCTCINWDATRNDVSLYSLHPEAPRTKH